LYRAPGQLFGFLLLPLKTIQIKRKKTMCCMSDGTKTMTKINAEGRAWGTGKI
jgi:hypothetical protein